MPYFTTHWTLWTPLRISKSIQKHSLQSIIVISWHYMACAVCKRYRIEFPYFVMNFKGAAVYFFDNFTYLVQTNIIAFFKWDIFNFFQFYAHNVVSGKIPNTQSFVLLHQKAGPTCSSHYKITLQPVYVTIHHFRLRKLRTFYVNYVHKSRTFLMLVAADSSQGYSRQQNW